jgi:hypothetical protein
MTARFSSCSPLICQGNPATMQRTSTLLAREHTLTLLCCHSSPPGNTLSHCCAVTPLHLVTHSHTAELSLPSTWLFDWRSSCRVANKLRLRLHPMCLVVASLAHALLTRSLHAVAHHTAPHRTTPHHHHALLFNVCCLLWHTTPHHTAPPPCASDACAACCGTPHHTTPHHHHALLTRVLLAVAHHTTPRPFQAKMIIQMEGNTTQVTLDIFPSLTSYSHLSSRSLPSSLASSSFIASSSTPCISVHHHLYSSCHYIP